MEYTVGEAAEYLHITPLALRYYEKEGLVPFVKRTRGDKRIFTEEDFEWLLIIGCLKKTGMPIKKIRDFVQLVQEGDKTITERKLLFYRQREEVEKRIAELKENLAVLNYKCRFYEQAEKAGTTESVPKPKDIPQSLRFIRKK